MSFAIPLNSMQWKLLTFMSWLEFTKLLTQTFALKIPAEISELFIYYTGHGATGSGDWVLQEGRQEEYLSATDVLDIFSSASTQIPTTLCCDCCSSGAWLKSGLSSYFEYPLRIITAAGHGETALVGNLLTFLAEGVLMFFEDETYQLQTPGLLTTDAFEAQDSILQFPSQYAIVETNEPQVAKGKPRHFRVKEVRHAGLRQKRRDLALQIKQGKAKEFHNREGYLPKLPKGQAYFEAGHPEHTASGRSMTAMCVVMGYDFKAKKLGYSYFSPTHYGQHRTEGAPDPNDPDMPRQNVFGRIAFQQIPKDKLLHQQSE